MTVVVDQSVGQVVVVESDPEYKIDVTLTEPQSVVVDVPGISGPPGKGVPIGGVEGQFLVKSSGEDYETEWVDLEDPSGAVKFDEVQTLSNEEKEQARDNIGARSADEILPVEYGGTGGVTPASARQGLGLIYASTKEAEDGIAANRVMSPLRTRHAIDAAIGDLPLLKTRLDGSTLYITSDGSEP